MYVIDGLITIFPSFEEADRFRKWYNKKYHTLDSDEVEYIVSIVTFLSFLSLSYT